MQSPWQTPTFPTPTHRRVHDLLRRLISDGAANFFADACEVAGRQPPYRTAAHVVGHLIREVESSVMQVLLALPDSKAWLAANPGSGSDGHKAKVTAILQALRLANHDVALAWTSFASKSSGWHGAAHRDDLRSPRTIDRAFQERLNQFVDILAVVLDAAEANYAVILGTLDRIRTLPTPSRADLAALVPYLGAGVTALAHLFETLPVGWLVPLREERVFSQPPDTQVHEGGSFSFPHWPQASYLRRIAPDAPPEVASTIESIPVVNNEFVHCAFLEAATRMPAAEAVRVARHEAAWIGGRPSLTDFMPHAIEGLATHLISQAEHEAARSFLRSALAFVAPGDGTTRRTRIGRRNHEDIVSRAVRALATVAPQVAKALLFELIDEGQEDPGRHWRAAIESHRQNGMREPLDALLVELRDLFLASVTDGNALRAAVTELEAREGAIYSRLALHLLRMRGDLAPDLVLARATNQTLLDSTQLFHELAEMIGARFPGLGVAERAQVVAALQRHASVETVTERLAGQGHDEATLRSIADRRRRRWYTILGSALPAELSSECEALNGGDGTMPHPTFYGWVGEVQTGPNSPRSAAELAALSDEELVRYVREWVAPADRWEASYRGLCSQLRTCATDEPARFSALAAQFRNLHPQCVAGLLWGLHEVARRQESAPPTNDDEAIDWDAVLTLAEWVATQATTSDAEENAGNWTWVRLMAVDIVTDAAQHDGVEVAERERAWKTLRVLLDDADPSNDPADPKDELAFAIHTVRGQALHHSLDLAFRLATGDADAKDLSRRICTELKRRLDPAVEPFFAVRAIFAQEFNRAFGADPALAASIARTFFSETAEVTREQGMAWRSFLRFNGAGTDTFAILEPYYRASVERISQQPEETTTDLGQHLVWLTMWEAVQIADDSLLGAFIDRAPAPSRAEALESVGRAVSRSDDEIPADFVARCRELWEWWSEAVTEGGREAADLAAFGWWFTSPVFDQAWALEMLPCALDAANGEIELRREVLLKLRDLAASSPEVVAECVGAMVEGGGEVGILGYQTGIRAVLSVLIQGPAAAAARAIASRIVARGWLQFRDLAQAAPGTAETVPA